ncbi:MAG: 3-phosphoshikimate 1-carboxyvinyltransferase, partial [Chloroflexota bacterium]|nr:3-phosphoshikimate 1-carboxyvinyltransferase [Chloroflexota bacterium]
MNTATLPDTAREVRAARSVRGIVRVPGDKSISHRAALFNALADGQARISNFSPGADCASTLRCLGDLGVPVARQGADVVISGVGLRGLQEPADVLDCGNSGTTMRLLTGILAGSNLYAVLSGDASLRQRPMARVIDPLRQAGARIDARAGGRLAPVTVAPGDGLRGTEHRLSVASAQVKSALVLAGLFADGPFRITEPAATRDHTERMLSAMGAQVHTAGLSITVEPAQRLRSFDAQVPGDFSAAAFWLALGCLHPRAEVRITDVGVNPTRTGLLTILRSMGAQVTVENPREVAGEPVADLTARSSG